MRFPYLPVFTVLSLTAAGISACGGSVNQAQGSGSGSGGGGGSETTTTTTPTTTTSSSTSTVDTTYPAFKPSVPQVITFGGAVLTAPKLVPVFFPNDAYQTQLTDFATKIGGTPYWAAVTSEYGVGPATVLLEADGITTKVVALTEDAPTTISDTDIQTWLAGKLNGDDPLWPAADENTVYILHYPASTTITQQGASSCQDFGGYHNNIALDAAHNGLNVAYAVVPRCASFGDLKGLDGVTGAESHELIEAATDPHPNADTAYGQVDDNHIYWEFALGGGEAGDMCAQFPGVFTKFSEMPYVVQRSWSNAAAKAGHDPCVPALSGEVYFNTVPILTDNISLAGATMKGVKIPVGSSKTIELDLFSDGDTGGPWSVTVKDFVQLAQGGAPTMNFSLDRDSGQNGDKLQLTIDVVKKNQFGAGIFLIESTQGQQTNLWVGLVGN